MIPTVAICAIVRDEATYIEEWVEFHRRQGVTQWRIYDNGSLDGTPAVLRKLGIEPVIWGGHPFDFDAQQRSAYAEGARMLAGHATWVAFIDVDEFIFGRGGKTLAEALAEVPPEASAIAVQQRIFGSSGHEKRTPGGVLERFTRCAVPTYAEHRWFKTIARPEMIRSFDSVHSVSLSAGSYVMVDYQPLTRDGAHPGEASRFAEGRFGLHHYILKSLEEFREKQAKWADRSAISRISDDSFFNRNNNANAQECLEIAPRAPAPAKVAALTMVYNERDLLPIWLRYYGNQVGQQNCFVLDHGSDDGSTDMLGAANRIRVPRSEFDEFKRAASISALCESLLQWYDFVVYTDVDEILVPDPGIASTLLNYCTADRFDVTTAIGLNLIHRVPSEPRLDLARPIMQQRSVAMPIASMCKPSLVRRPVKWAIGFHSYDGPVKFDGLYLFHLAYADKDTALRRQEKRRQAVVGHPYANHPHKLPDSAINKWIEDWSRCDVEPVETEDAMLARFQSKIIDSQAGRENDRFRINLDIKGDALWSIPERFKTVF